MGKKKNTTAQASNKIHHNPNANAVKLKKSNGSSNLSLPNQKLADGGNSDGNSQGSLNKELNENSINSAYSEAKDSRDVMSELVVASERSTPTDVDIINEKQINENTEVSEQTTVINEAGDASAVVSSSTEPFDSNEDSVQTNELKKDINPTDNNKTPLVKDKVLPVELNAWQIAGDAIQGLAHRRKGIPCQDAVHWQSFPRPLLALSDGAGSGLVSEYGAQCLVRGSIRFLASMDDAISVWLDSPSRDCNTVQLEARAWAVRLLRHAQGLLTDLAHTEKRKMEEIRATLQVVIIGKLQTFWWQVGDGSIVLRKYNGMHVLGERSANKGEFANQTCFVDHAKIDDIQFGLLKTADIYGMALMSDGGAEKLISYDGLQVANRLSMWFQHISTKDFKIDDFAKAYHEPAMYERTTLDDRSVLIASRTL